MRSPFATQEELLEAHLVSGGFDGATSLPSAELYDPNAGTFALFNYILHEGPLSYYAALAAFCAIGSHVLLDSMTKMGVPLLGPFDNKMRGLRWLKGSSPVWNYLLLAAGGLMMLAYYSVI